MALTKITSKVLADDAVSTASLADGIIQAAHLHESHGITTSNIGEGSNKYYSDARARTAVSVGGSLAYNSSTGVITFAQRTDSTIRGLVSVTDSGGDGSLAYNNSTGVITYTGPSASEVRAHFSAGSNITISSGQISTHAVYTHPTTAGNKHVPTGGSSGQHLKYSASGTAVWAAETGHDSLSGFVAAEHIDWAGASAGTLHATNIANDAIDSQHYAAGSIDLEHMSANSIDSSQYVDGSIDLAHMSADSIDSTQYVDGSIDLAHMSANSIDSAQYVDGSIDLAHMSANSIDSSQYVDGSIDTAHIGDDQVTAAKLANTAVTAASYGSSTAIPVVTVDAQGRITGASTAAISSSLTVGADSGTDDVVTVGTDTLDFVGTSNEIETTVSNNQIQIGLPNNVTISGNLTVSGDTLTVNTSTLAVEDPLVSLATGNSSADAVDIGIYGLYDTSGSQDLYAGLFRDASDSGKWKLFKDNQAAPTTTVNTSGTGYAAGTLVANLEGNVTGTVTGNTTGTAATVTGATQAAITTTANLVTVGTIGTGVWQGTAIASGYIAADAITGAKIADNAIDSEHYTDASIDLAHMSVNSIDSTQYVDGSIDLAHMSANSIDSTQYVDGSIDTAHIAASQITNTLMADNAIDSAEITAGAIDLAHMSANSIDSTQYVDGSIDTAHIAADQITSALIADDQIDSEHYVDGSIDNAHLGAGIVNSDEIAAGAIDLAHMSANSIDSAQYVDGSIDNAHLGAGIVNSDEIAAGAVDLAHLSASGTASSSTFLRGDNAWTAVTPAAIATYTNSTNNRIITSVDSSTVNSEANLTFDGTTLALTGNQTVSGTLAVTGETTLSAHLNMGEEDRIKLGDSGTFEIYSGDTNSTIKNATGSLYFRSDNNVYITNLTTSKNSIAADTDGAVTLYYDNAAKLATASGGVTVTGTLGVTGVINLTSHLDMPDNARLNLGTGDDFYIYHDGNNAKIINTTGNLTLNATSNEVGVDITANGAVNLYYDGTSVFRTTAHGGYFTGAIAGDQEHLIIKNTNADAYAACISLFKDSASPADNDQIGKFNFYADDDAGNQTDYARIMVTSADVSNGSEDASMFFRTRVAGSNTDVMSLVGGKVGIGTTAPIDPISLVWNSSGGIIGYKSGSTGTPQSAQRVFSIGTGSSGSNSGTDPGQEHGFFQLFHNNSEKIRLFATGDSWINTGEDFGIGTASPGARLDVYGGDIKVIDAAGTGGSIYGMDVNHSIYFREGGVDRTNYYQYGGNKSDDKGHRFFTGGVKGSQSLKLQIANNGTYVASKLSVNVVDTDYRMQINGSTTTMNDGTGACLFINSTDNTTSMVMLGCAQDPNTAGIGYTRTGSRIWMTAGGGSENPASNSFVLTGAGKVGIGVVDPDCSLELAGTDAMSVPSGTTGQRPTARNGMMRYNTTTDALEVYVDGEWKYLDTITTFTASGGSTNTYTIGSTNYKSHTFLSSGTFTPDVAGDVDVLLIAGGGSGGGDNGGGGGAGGMLEIEGYTVSVQGYSIVIGAGAAARAGSADDGPGNKGSNSTGFGYTAIGGGAGTGWTNAGGAGTLSGGSGGGQGASNGGPNAQAPGSGTSGQGNAGGIGIANWAGGGGGKGSVGTAGSSNRAGTGGTGKASNWRSGSNVTYCGGGTGGWNVNGGYSSSGHGYNNGVVKNTTDDASGEGACAANTGHGGHGSNHDNNTSGAGGSGIVVVRYAL